LTPTLTKTALRASWHPNWTFYTRAWGYDDTPGGTGGGNFGAGGGDCGGGDFGGGGADCGGG
ncbi:unnamed protein product, partial [Oikopleura dioica]